MSFRTAPPAFRVHRQKQGVQVHACRRVIKARRGRRTGSDVAAVVRSRRVEKGGVGQRIMTNKPACGPMRGHGIPRSRFTLECLINMMCEENRLDPVKVRMLNGMEPNYRTCNDLDIRSCEYKQTLERVVKASGWREKAGKLPKGRGIGIAGGGGRPEEALPGRSASHGVHAAGAESR